jgi:hypothetical protein
VFWLADTVALTARQQPPLGISGAPVRPPSLCLFALVAVSCASPMVDGVQDADDLALEFGVAATMHDACLRAALTPHCGARSLISLAPFNTADAVQTPSLDRSGSCCRRWPRPRSRRARGRRPTTWWRATRWSTARMPLHRRCLR